MGAGCCKQSDAVVSQSEMQQQHAAGTAAGEQKNNGPIMSNDNNIDLAGIIAPHHLSNNSINIINQQPSSNNLGNAPHDEQGTQSSTSYTTTSSSIGTIPAVAASNTSTVRHTGGGGFLFSSDASSSSSASTALAKDTPMTAALKSIMQIALPCSSYFRGMEGVFYCDGDNDCPVLLGNPSEEIWGGGPPTKQMLSVCEKELAYLKKMNVVSETTKKKNPPSSPTSPKLEDMMKQAAAEEDEKRKNSSKIDADAEALEEARGCLSPREAVNNSENNKKEVDIVSGTSENDNDDDNDDQNNSNSTKPKLTSSTHPAFLNAKKTLPDSKKSSIYTADSSPCRCARHAGLIGREGGIFIVVCRPGQQQYLGSVSSKSGLRSHNHGAYDLSIEVVGFV